jgi:hypothetical protein
MIDLLVQHAGDPARDSDLIRALAADAQVVALSAGRGDVHLVHESEAAVMADPGAAFSFDPSGDGILSVGQHRWHAGRFEPVSLGQLRQRAVRAGARGRLRWWLIDGSAAPTDIGSLQAQAGEGALFQVASQFNCLEAPGPALTPVARYLTDPTQGPRASISAFPGTLLRHYAAPDGQGGRFVQTDGGRQIELLGDVCDPAVARVRNGYLMAQEIHDPRALFAALETRFDQIRVGVHDDVQVVLGYDWSGAVERTPPPRIAQLFTSTLAGGAYGALSPELEGVCQQLLRAAYLGTLLGAVALGRHQVMLTLIGGGVFGNPIVLIWQAILWALDQVAPVITRDMTIVVNGREIAQQLSRETLIKDVRARDGVWLSWPRAGAPTLHR